jgi:hypothetical protein
MWCCVVSRQIPNFGETTAPIFSVYSTLRWYVLPWTCTQKIPTKHWCLYHHPTRPVVAYIARFSSHHYIKVIQVRWFLCLSSYALFLQESSSNQAECHNKADLICMKTFIEHREQTIHEIKVRYATLSDTWTKVRFMKLKWDMLHYHIFGPSIR